MAGAVAGGAATACRTFEVAIDRGAGGGADARVATDARRLADFYPAGIWLGAGAATDPGYRCQADGAADEVVCAGRLAGGDDSDVHRIAGAESLGDSQCARAGAHVGCGARSQRGAGLAARVSGAELLHPPDAYSAW